MRPRTFSFPFSRALSVAATLVGLLAFSGDALADQGYVVLQNGGRATGNVTLVLPNDRVVVQLPDGTSVTFPWADVQLVSDGPRTYDRYGNLTTVPGSDARPLTTASGTGSYVPNEPVMQRQSAYDALPTYRSAAVLRRAGGAFLGIGALLLAITPIGCNTDEWSGTSDCSVRNTLIGVGASSAMLGFALIGGGVHRSRLRQAGLLRLQNEPSSTRQSYAPSLHLSARIDPGTFVPTLTLRF